jgi:hypothetical protein
MKRVGNILLVIIILLFSALIVQLFLKKPNLMPVGGQLKKLDLNDVNKVMVVAHPGDESLWGAGHLLTDKYLVVCVSCGYDKKMEKQFIKSVKMSGNPVIMMGMSDRFDKYAYKSIKKDLTLILNYKDWQLVVTHNPHGEYGNFQHKKISQFVSNIHPNNLYYFGKIYSRKELHRMDKTTNLKGIIIKKKIEMIKNYGNSFGKKYEYMVPFEDWKIVSEWKN